jgi:hypothetical protein
MDCSYTGFASVFSQVKKNTASNLENDTATSLANYPITTKCCDVSAALLSYQKYTCCISFLSKDLKERFQNIAHIMLQVHHVTKKHRPNYSLMTNCTPHTLFFVMNWAFIYCVRNVGVLVMGILGIHKTAKTKASFITHEKKHWMDNSVMDRLQHPTTKDYVHNWICRIQLLHQ